MIANQIIWTLCSRLSGYIPSGHSIHRFHGNTEHCVDFTLPWIVGFGMAAGTRGLVPITHHPNAGCADDHMDQKSVLQEITALHFHTIFEIRLHRL